MSKFLLLAALSAVIYYGHVEYGPKIHGRIGIQDEYLSKNHRKITKVFLNSPADKAGLLPGDEIIFVNDLDIDGPPYTKIQLIIVRNKQKLYFTIERLPWKMVSTKYAVPKHS